jgi:hypothetical protein
VEKFSVLNVPRLCLLILQVKVERREVDYLKNATEGKM